MKRVTLFGLLPIALLLMAASYTVDFYAKQQVEKFAQKCAEATIDTWDKVGSIRELSLGDVMIENVHTITDSMAGIHTSPTYKSGWRAKAVNNPNALLAVIGLYAEDFVSHYEQAVTAEVDKLRSPDADWRERPNWCNIDSVTVEWNEHRWRFPDQWTIDSLVLDTEQRLNSFLQDSIATERRLASFNMSQVWEVHHATLDRYQSLISAAKELPAGEFEDYAATVGKDCYDEEGFANITSWMAQQNLELPEETYSWSYPKDFWAFHYRLPNDFPSLTAENLLNHTEAAFAMAKANIPSQ